MPRPLSVPVDPVFAEIAKAIYGDVDPRDLLVKFSPGGSDLHIDRPLSDKEAKRQKRVAQTGLAATGVATVAGLDATRAALKEGKHRVAEGKEGRAVGPVARQLVRMKVSPKAAGLAVGTGLLGLHAVELGADALGAHAQLKALKQANGSNPKKPVSKGFRLRPLNSLPVQIPSLRAKRPKLTPSPANPVTRAGLYQPVTKGLRAYLRAGKKTLRTVKSTTAHAEGAAKQAEEATAKINSLIPSRRTAALAAAGAGGALVLGPAAGSYAGSYAGTRRGSRSVAKSVVEEVTWTGQISKVDTDKRQVFGWASVSAINGQEVVDLQGDVVPIEETEKAAYRYVIDSRKGGDMHKRVAKFDEPLHTADMIESFVVTPEKLEKMGLPADSLPHGWWVGYHVNDDAQWEMVKSGERQGFSIHGLGKRTPLAKSLDDVKDKVGDARKKAAKQVHRTTADLKRRADQAINPPPVKLHRVKSSAIDSMGYQPQTRRLAVTMRSRPDQPYEYKMKTGAAVNALTASSKGSHYATQVRGKAPRAQGYSVGDRTRLFLSPQVSKADRTTQGLAAGSAASAGAATGLGIAGYRKGKKAAEQHRTASRRLGYASQTIAGGMTTTDHRLPGPPNVIPNKKAFRTLDHMIGVGNNEHQVAFKTLRRAGRLKAGAAAAGTAAVGLGAAAARHHHLSKADRRQLGYPPNEAGSRLGEGVPQATGRRRFRITSMPTKAENIKGKAGDFRRGAKGGVRGGFFNNTRAENSSGAKATRKFHLDLATQNHSAYSDHPGAFKAGAKAGGRAGRAAGSIARHPNAVVLGAVAGPAAVGAAVRTAKEHQEARQRLEAKRAAATVAKALHPALGGALAGGVVGGLVAGGNELNRRSSNRRGAQLGALEMYTHPIRAGHKAGAAGWAESHRFALERAAANEQKAKGNPDSLKGERAAVHAERWRRNANMAAYNTHLLHRAAAVGAKKAHQETGQYNEKKKYKVPSQYNVGKGLVNGGPPRDHLPGDNRDAQQARSRRTAGLGTAGVGYLVASRAADIAPGAADWATPSAKRIGKKPHKIMRAARTKSFTRIGRKGGAALVGAGLLAAGEGTFNDLRNRGSFSRAHDQVKNKLHKSAFGVEDDRLAKAYQRGDITYHQEEAQLHSRKKAAADRRAKAGVTVAGAGAALGGALHGSAEKIGHTVAPGHVGDKVAQRVKLVGHIKRSALIGGAGTAATGLAVAAQGAVSRLHHGHAQNVETRAAQQSRRQRNASVAKAFSAEQYRHKRQDMYAGGAAGGAVVAGSGATAAAIKARQARKDSRKSMSAAEKSSKDLRAHIAGMATPASAGGTKRTVANFAEATRLHEEGTAHIGAGLKAAAKGRKLTRVGIASGLASAALGGAAYGLHDYDRRRGGRSYGY